MLLRLSETLVSQSSYICNLHLYKIKTREQGNEQERKSIGGYEWRY